MFDFQNYPKEKLQEHILKSLDRSKRRSPQEEYAFWVKVEKDYLSNVVKEKLSVRAMDWIRGYGPFTFGLATMFLGAYLMNELDPVHLAHPETKDKLFFIEEPKRLKNFCANYYEELVAKYKT